MAESAKTASIKDAFRRFDVNDDGVIDASELCNVLKALDPESEVWTDEAIHTLLASLDTNGDGRIQYDEFVDWIYADRADDQLPESKAFLEIAKPTSNEGSEQDEGSSDEEAKVEGERQPKGTRSNSSAKAKAKSKKKSTDAATVKCEKTLEFGKPIRSAICIGKQVWTVDWQGAVSIRERDDASKVVGQIATERFVWSMLHMKPGLMWMGLEANGIALFDTKKQEFKDTLRGGHSGGVLCMAVDDSLGDEESAGPFPPRKAWSGSNDFTIREWTILTWISKKQTPKEVSDDGEAIVLALGKWKVGIMKSKNLYGHKNGVKDLLKIGPTLWSASDDGCIRLWRCLDGECAEVVEDAHKGGVNKIAVVKSFVWSAGADGLVKEWTMGGQVRECVRQVAPPGSDKGIYALLPMGHDVWVCGHHPEIQVYSQRDMTQTSAENGHKPYVSTLIGVDRIETKIVWSTSSGDRKLKVWRRTTRGDEPSVDELKAANLLYQQEEATQAERTGEYLRKLEALEASAAEQSKEVETLEQKLAEVQDRCQKAENDLAGLRKIIEDAGLGHLLTDPEALNAFVKRAAQLDKVLREMGFGDLLDDPHEIGKQLQILQQLREVLERCGFGHVLESPTELEAVLLRINALKQVFGDCGFSELFENPEKLRNFLQTYNAVRSEFQNFDLAHVLDDAQAAQAFLKKHSEDEQELLQAREQLLRLEAAEKELAERISELQSRDTELASALAKVEALTSSLREQSEKAGFLEQGLEEAEARYANSEAHRRLAEETAAALKQDLDALRKIIEDAGLGHLLEDPDALKAFVERAAQLERVLRDMGFGHLLDDPHELGKQLQILQQLREVLERCGFGHILDNPAELEAVLLRINALKQVFDDCGFSELFEDPQKLRNFLQTLNAIRGEFQNFDLAHVLDDAQAAHTFLQKHSEDERELWQAREQLLRLEAAEKELAERTSELQARDAELASALAEVESLTASLKEQSEKATALEQQLEDAEARYATSEEQRRLADEAADALKQTFEEVGLGHLLSDLDALKTFLQRAAKLEAALRDHGLGRLFNDPAELGRLLDVFDELGVSHLLTDPDALKSYLEKAAKLEQQCEEASRELQRLREQLGELELRFEQSQYDSLQLAKLRKVFEDAGRATLLEEYDAVSTDDALDDVDDLEDDDEELGDDECDEHEDDEGEADEDEDEDEEDEEDEEDDDDDEDEDDDEIGVPKVKKQKSDVAANRAEDASKKVEAAAKKAAAKEAGAKKAEERAAKKAKAIAAKRAELAKLREERRNNRPSFVALKGYLSRNSAVEKVFRDAGMAALLDDPPELARLLKMLKDLRSVLAANGLEILEPAVLGEMLSRYNMLKAVFEEQGFAECFEDPEYTLKGYLRNFNRIREEFDKYGLGYLLDSVPAMRDFLAKYHDMQQELQSMKEARTGEKLAARDQELARLDASLAKKEAEIEALKARLKEYEQLGDVDSVKRWKSDSDELKRLKKICDSMRVRLSEMEQSLRDKERERQEALELEKSMALKYKELDIFKLDIIARELKGLDSKLGGLGNAVKDLQQGAARCKSYDDQQRMGQQSDRMLDQCKMLRAHIRDVINKCLSETQKMHIGVAIDDHLAAGELKDGGTMVGFVYEEVERPDHGHSRAAKLRQQDEMRGGR